jgi:hypothetical protein
VGLLKGILFQKNGDATTVYFIPDTLIQLFGLITIYEDNRAKLEALCKKNGLELFQKRELLIKVLLDEAGEVLKTNIMIQWKCVFVALMMFLNLF